jgi:toxin ParE1/3/4
MRFVWLPTATRDLQHLQTYLNEHSPANTQLVVERILRAVERLAQFPYQGRVGRGTGTRELVVQRTPYIIIYWIIDDDGAGEILRVLHGAQRWPAV